MRQQQAGRILNIGPVLGFLPAPYLALYAASKHAIEGYSESLDHELRTRGIRAATAARPKLRYTAGTLANRLRLLRRFAPAGVLDAGVRKDLRLDARQVAR